MEIRGRPRRIIPASLAVLGTALVLSGIVMMLAAYSTSDRISQRGCGGAACAYLAAQVEPGFLVFVSGLATWSIGLLWAGWVAMTPARTAEARWP